MDVEVTHVSGVFSGTVTHMAPETLRVGQQSKAADVYAFGILLYELFTADSAYRGLPQTAIIDMVLNRRARPVLPPDTPRHVALLAANCMEEEPGRRPSMAAVRDQLATLAQQYATQPAPTVTARQVGDERMVLDTPCDGAPCSGTTAREGGVGSNECDGGASMLSDGEGLPPRMRVPSVFVGDKELTLVPSHSRRPSAPVGVLNALREGDEGSGREDSEEEQSTLMFVASFMPTGNDDTTETSSACHNKKDGVGEASLV
jgi:serine/threonine protein kinase